MYPDFDPQAQLKAMADRGVGGAVSLNVDTSAEDRSLGVTFIMEPRHNAEKSLVAGRPIYDEVEICEIKIPGSQDKIRNVVSDKERYRFAAQYDAFKRGLNQDAVSGTPLSEWPLMTRGQVEEARFFGARTVEHLADLSDAGLQRMGAGWGELRKKAKDWLIKAKDGALLARMRTELEERDRRIDALEKMLKKQAEELHRPDGAVSTAQPDRMAALEAKLEAMLAVKAEPPKRRGRPPKAKTAEPS